MIVITRQKDESIMIGNEIEIVIVDIQGDKVHLSIKSPKALPIHRREVFEAIEREKKSRPE